MVFEAETETETERQGGKKEAGEDEEEDEGVAGEAEDSSGLVGGRWGRDVEGCSGVDCSFFEGLVGRWEEGAWAGLVGSEVAVEAGATPGSGDFGSREVEVRSLWRVGGGFPFGEMADSLEVGW